MVIVLGLGVRGESPRVRRVVRATLVLGLDVKIIISTCPQI